MKNVMNWKNFGKTDVYHSHTRKKIANDRIKNDNAVKERRQEFNTDRRTDKTPVFNRANLQPVQMYRNQVKPQIQRPSAKIWLNFHLHRDMDLHISNLHHFDTSLPQNRHTTNLVLRTFIRSERMALNTIVVLN